MTTEGDRLGRQTLYVDVPSLVSSSPLAFLTHTPVCSLVVVFMERVSGCCHSPPRTGTWVSTPKLRTGRCVVPPYFHVKSDSVDSLGSGRPFQTFHIPSSSLK